MCDTLQEYVSEPLDVLLSQLKADEDQDPEAILLRYQGLLLRHPDLEKIYVSLGFSPRRGAFKSALEKTRVIAALSGELLCKSDLEGDLDIRPEDVWEVHRPMRCELSRTFSNEHMEELADLHEIGLCDEFPDFPEKPEDPDLSSMWCPDPYSTPRPKGSALEFATPRSSRGLKQLSIKVKELVSKNNITSYKEVADELINSVPDEGERRRDEKNIHRRVYDALNVLDAAGVIAKQGKQVTWVGHCSPVLMASGSCEEMRLRVERKRAMLREKSEMVHSLLGLIERNRRKPQRDRLGFPFIVVATRGSPYNQVSIVASGGQCKLRAKMKWDFQLLSDVDLLKQLKHLRPAPLSAELSRLLSP